MTVEPVSFMERMESFLGKWKMVEIQNFDEYLKAIGIYIIYIYIRVLVYLFHLPTKFTIDRRCSVGCSQSSIGGASHWDLVARGNRRNRRTWICRGLCQVQRAHRDPHLAYRSQIRTRNSLRGAAFRWPDGDRMPENNLNQYLESWYITKNKTHLRFTYTRTVVF